MFEELPFGIYRHTAPEFVTTKLGKQDDPLTLHDPATNHYKKMDLPEKMHKMKEGEQAEYVYKKAKLSTILSTDLNVFSLSLPLQWYNVLFPFLIFRSSIHILFYKITYCFIRWTWKLDNRKFHEDDCEKRKDPIWWLEHSQNHPYLTTNAFIGGIDKQYDGKKL